MLLKFKSFMAALRTPLVVAALGCATIAVPVSAQFKQGTDYRLIDPPQATLEDGKIEVLEFFAYGCGACDALESKLEQWAKRQPADVMFRRVPAAVPNFKLRGIDNAPLFYTLESMGLLTKLHEKIFQAANRDGVILASGSDLNKWLEKQGVDTKVFEATAKSFTVDAKTKGAIKLAEQYKISSTPTMVVGGKYISSQTQGPDHFLAVIDFLVAQVRATAKKPVSSVSTAAVAAGAVGATAVVGGAAAVAATKAVAKPKVVKPKVAEPKDFAKPAVATQ